MVPKSPRALRDAVSSGRIARNELAEAPGNWPEWRRKRMQVAIKAADMFLGGDRWHVILKALVAKKLVRDSDLTKSRTLQYVARGCRYLSENGGFSQVNKKKSTDAVR